MHLADGALQVDRAGSAIAAAVDQLVLDVADPVAVGLAVAFGALGGNAKARVRVADAAFGDVVAGFGVGAQHIGANELVTTAHQHITGVFGRGAGAGQAVAFDLGRQLVADGGLRSIGRRCFAEGRQCIGGWTQVPVDRLLIGQRRQGDGNAQRQGQESKGSAHVGSADWANGS